MCRAWHDDHLDKRGDDFDENISKMRVCICVCMKDIYILKKRAKDKK